MNESTTPHSEIIELLEKTIKENERKLNVLSNELNKTPKKSNRFHELTHIIRITKQELEFNKEDLKSAENIIKEIGEEQTNDTDRTINLNEDEFAGLQITVIEIRDNARLQRRTGLSYLDCIALKNKFNAING